MKNIVFKLETEALDYKQNFGFNVLPLIGKKPIGEWTQWQDTLQTLEDVLALDWRNNITGLAAICGLNDLLCLDLDDVKTEKILEKILEYLKLSKEYKWIVKTNTGFHIWIIVKDINRIFNYFGKGFAYKKFYPNEKETLKHLELRVKNCYVALPPSKHPSGNRYYFIYGKPDELPEKVAADAITYMLGDLFNQVNRQKILGTNLRWEADTKYIASAIQSLKKNRLGYDIWRDCCFALASLGESGRKYFRELSKNKFYPNDDDNVIDRQFDECLKRYDSTQIKLNSLFHYAKAFGFKYGQKRDQLSKKMLTYPLSILRCKENELVEKFISYGFIRLKEDELEKSEVARSLNDEEIQTFLNKFKINFLTSSEVKTNYLEIEQALTDFEMKHGTDAYGLIGLDFLLDCKQGKFSYNEVRSYAAVKAILGRTIKLKPITYQRIKVAYWGYKSWAIFNSENKNEILVSVKTLYRRLKKLKERGFISIFSYGRKAYYSTYLPQEKLKKMVMQRVLEKEVKRIENNDADWRKMITQQRMTLRLKKQNKIV